MASEAPMVSDELVSMLRCLEDRSPLHLAAADLLERLNEAIADGKLKNRGGQVVDREMDACLVRADNKIGYPVVSGIPKMLADEAFEIEQ